MPATIDDPVILDEIGEALKGHGDSARASAIVVPGERSETRDPYAAAFR